MNKLLLITGDMAAGKSTFSHMLGERYGLPVFNKDTLKEVMSNTLPFTDREDNLRLSHAAIDLLLFLFEQLTPLHTSLILEANFHGGEMERLRTLSEEKGYQLMILALQGDLPTLHKRYLHRTGSGQRHPVHLSVKLEDYPSFCAYMEKERARLPEDALLVDATTFSYQSDPTLLHTLDTFFLS